MKQTQKDIGTKVAEGVFEKNLTDVFSSLSEKLDLAAGDAAKIQAAVALAKTGVKNAQETLRECYALADALPS